MESGDISKLKIEAAAKRPFKRRRGYLLWAALAMAAALVFLGLKGLLSPTFDVKAATVSLTYPSQALTLLNASGYVAAGRKASVASKATGRLVWIGVEEGSRVRKGQVIARLENEDMAAAKAQSEANLNVSDKALDQAKAELDDAQVNFQRDKKLLLAGVISKTEYDAAETRYKKALAAIESARASVKANEAALKGADVAYEYTLIRAPFDAVVLTKNADAGDIITPFAAAANAKAAVVTIADMGSLLVEADVSESNIEKVKKGQPCEIQLDAIPDERFMGEVHMVVPTADRSKGSVMVKVRFLRQDPRTLPEMSAKVSFLSRPLTPGEEKPRTAVDPSAVVSRGRGNSVFVLNGGTVTETPVETGAMLGPDAVEVRAGIKAGDKIVKEPPGKLKTGSKVRLIEK